jgi:hypothetical protein
MKREETTDDERTKKAMKTAHDECRIIMKQQQAKLQLACADLVASYFNNNNNNNNNSQRVSSSFVWFLSLSFAYTNS